MLHYNHITHLITKLLHQHDCVILPNFGGFVARHYASNFNKGNTVLYPQTKQLLFNKNLIHNDGLLVSGLMELNTISFDEATKQLTNYIDYVKSLLNAKKRFELLNIGLLYIDAENTIRFEPKVEVNFLLDSFGFESIIANELIFETEKPIVNNQFEDRKIVIESPIVKKKNYARIATLAVGLPITLAFLLFAANSKPMKPLLQSSLNPFYTPEKTYFPIKTQRQLVILKADEIMPLLADANGYSTFRLSDSSNTLIASNNTNTEAVKTHSHSITKTNHKATQFFDGNYQVVVGCFGVKENASKLIVELAKSNILAGISGTNAKGLHVVSCGGFDSKLDAKQLLTSVKVNYPNAWVMSK